MCRFWRSLVVSGKATIVVCDGWLTYFGPRENNSDCKPNHGTISNEIPELEPYQLLLTIHDNMVVSESFIEEVKGKIIKAVEDRLNLTPKVKSERIN